MADILLFLVLTILGSMLFAKLIKGGKKEGKANLPPGPPKLPIIGNLHQLSKPLHRSLSSLSEQYGPLMHLQLGSQPTLVVSSAEMAKTFLKTHDLDCCNRSNLFFLGRLSYNNSDLAFSPYGEQWRSLRKIFTQELLSPHKVASLGTLREEEVDKLISSISHSAAGSIPVNLSEVIATFSAKVMNRMAFGKVYCEANRMNEMLSKIHKLTSRFYVADLWPGLRWVDWMCGSEGEAEKTLKILDDVYEEIIRERLDPLRREMNSEGILDTILRLHREPTKNITVNNVKGLLMNLVLAGIDTVSSTLEWALTELVRNPHTMKKMQMEVQRVAGKNGKIEATYIENLSYLNMIINETLRLHPPVPLLIPREIMEEFNVNGYDIIPKTRLVVNAWAIGREAANWERPDEFNPERFVDSSIGFKGQSFQFIPFGAGRRMCPGIIMGMATIEIALTNLIHAFKWDLLQRMRKEDIDLEETVGINMRKKNPLILMAKVIIK